jgi:hypothetical protein
MVALTLGVVAIVSRGIVDGLYLITILIIFMAGMT